MIDLKEYREDLENIVWQEILRQRDIPDILAESREVFPRQAEFIESAGNKKALFCTRRSAKSFTGGLYLAHTALTYPGCNCLYLGLTRDSAKGIVWKDILKTIDTKYGLDMRFNEQSLTATLPNGSVIYITGIDAKQDEMVKLLGRKYKLVIIDEASMYTVDLNNLVYGILDPAVTDQGGTICMSGTASNLPRGLFYKITTAQEKGWALYEWSAHDNPYVAKKWAEKLREIETDRPLYMQTPQFKQWYLNEWVIDTEKLVYKLNIDTALVEELPRLDPSLWCVVLGVDTGWEDDTGLCLTAYHLHDPHLYVLRCFKAPKMTFDEVVAKIDEFNRTSYVNNVKITYTKVIIDGANKQGVESMKSRSNIPFEYADKRDKATFIEILNSDLTQGKIKFLKDGSSRQLIDEMLGLTWVTDGDMIKYPKREHPLLPNHLCDAFLYAWRCGYHYSAIPEVKTPVMYSADWYQAQSQSIWEREAEHIKRHYGYDEEGSLGDLG